MAFNFGSLLTAIGRSLPGYVEGQRQAIQDNWQDLTNYNQVQKGQLENMWTEATWDPALANVYMQTARNEMGTIDNMRTLVENMAAHPGNVAAYNVYSANIADALRRAYASGSLVDPTGRMGNFGGYFGYPNRDMYDPNWQQRNMPPGAQQQPQQPQQPEQPLLDQPAANQPLQQ